MTQQDYSPEKQVAIDAVLKASAICEKVFYSLVLHENISKADQSPVTVADFASQAVINYLIHEAFPEDIIIAEEESATLKESYSPHILEKVLNLVRLALGNSSLSLEQVYEYLDYGRKITYPASKSIRYWTVDPVDGTKGFLRGEQYAVCVSLVNQGSVQLGVLGCPNYLNVHNIFGIHQNFADQRGILFFAIRGVGAFERTMHDPQERRLHVSTVTKFNDATLCESFENSHSSHSKSATISRALGITTHPVRMDSQCKYAAIARGDVSIYFRLPPNSAYKEYIWDHAPGALLVQEAGGIVTDIHGKPLDFSQQPKLLTNIGILATNGILHEAVLAAALGI